jgi:hypothetical protein
MSSPITALSVACAMFCISQVLLILRMKALERRFAKFSRRSRLDRGDAFWDL